MILKFKYFAVLFTSILVSSCSSRQLEPTPLPLNPASSVASEVTKVAAKTGGLTSLAAAVVGDNILDPAAASNQLNYAINERYYGVSMDIAGWSTSAYCSVEPNVYYASNNNLVHGAWYDAQQQFIAPFGDGLAPAQAAYVRVSVQTPIFASTMLIYGGSVPNTYRPFYGLAQQATRPLKGRKAVMLGTSLTYQHVYVDFLKERTQLDTIINRGFPGQLLRTMADNLTAADVAGATFISIEGPTNDYGHGFATAGQVTDDPSMPTICGSLKYVVIKIRALNPTVPIIVLNNTWRGAYGIEPVPPAANFYGLTLEDACQAMMATADYLKLPHWDAYHLSGITQANIDDNTVDHLHWNDAGGKKVGYGYGDYLNQLAW